MADDEWRRVQAPWGSPEIVSLSAFQNCGEFHPYTCLHHPTRNLIPSGEGFRCPQDGCAYRQDWAWAWTADNRWRAIMAEATAEETVEPKVEPGDDDIEALMEALG